MLTFSSFLAAGKVGRGVGGTSARPQPTPKNYRRDFLPDPRGVNTDSSLEFFFFKSCFEGKCSYSKS